MEKIKWITTPDCRSCVFELEHYSKKTVEHIAQERKKLPKCRDCVRLKEHGL